MSKSRKTIQIKSLLDYANKVLADESPESSVEQRTGVILMIEEALWLAKRNRGFSRLSDRFTPDTRYDDTRRFYL